MPIEIVSGDLFVNRFKAQALAQGCNCQGSMGAGIAVGFRERYPEMVAAYRRLCKAKPREFNPGDIYLWKAESQPWVFNLATQENFWRSRATYENLRMVMEKMRSAAETEGVQSIAIPQIGAGYGGLSWKKCRVIIEDVFRDWVGTLYVYETFVPGE